MSAIKRMCGKAIGVAVVVVISVLCAACEEAGADDSSSVPGGTLDITVTGGAETTGSNDDVMFFGVFPDGEAPAENNALSFCEDHVFQAGTPTTTGAVRAISDEDTDPDTIWYGTGGVTYDVYVFVDEDFAHSGSSDGPQTGDRMYQFEYTQNGNEARTIDLSAFGTM